MAHPKAYDPQKGYMYQILTKYGSEPYEHCDYAKDKQEKNHLVKEYKMAYRSNCPAFKVILLPAKYHPNK